MIHSTHDLANWQRSRDAWVSQVEAIASQVREWSLSKGWVVQSSEKLISENADSYWVPSLHIEIPQKGSLLFEPIALLVSGSGGRVDLEAFPTLSRVKLIAGDDWQIMTDSNVPLRQPWNEQTFLQLVQDLLN